MHERALERFLQKVSIHPNGCWLWTGSTRNGYGQVRIDKVLHYSHRILWEHVYDKQPVELDHLCRTPRCVNPEHLEDVTHRTNVLRGRGQSARNAVKTHCKRNHPLSGQNLKMVGSKRQCRTCINARKRTAYHNRKGKE
jgi:hypothetical protein